MRFEFYIIEQGAQVTVRFRELEAARVEAPPDSAVDVVNSRFRELVASNPELGSMIVVSPSMGEPPGVVVAAECIHAWPVRVRKQQGRAVRELVWVVDESTGLALR